MHIVLFVVFLSLLGLNNLASEISMYRHLLGEHFCNQFHEYWSKRMSSEGRWGLYHLFSNFIKSKTKGEHGYQEDIIENFSSEGRYFILKLSMYTAYLIVSNEFEFRKAYDLLYELKIIIDKTNQWHNNNSNNNNNNNQQLESHTNNSTHQVEYEEYYTEEIDDSINNKNDNNNNNNDEDESSIRKKK